MLAFKSGLKLSLIFAKYERVNLLLPWLGYSSASREDVEA
jgi:hypothetical protein